MARSVTELSDRLAGLMSTIVVAGADAAIYDPEPDPKGLHARPIVDRPAKGFARA
jgi:hypothetical protein